jgi:hypothetical protein
LQKTSNRKSSKSKSSQLVCVAAALPQESHTSPSRAATRFSTRFKAVVKILVIETMAAPCYCITEDPGQNKLENLDMTTNLGSFGRFWNLEAALIFSMGEL